MRVLMITENDPAGTAILFAKAVNALTPHTCRLVTTQFRYTHNYEIDLHVPRPDGPNPERDGTHASRETLDELEQLLRESDVFHFHLVHDEHLPLGPFKAKDFLAGKAIVHHHHGHPEFRGNPRRFQEKYKKLGRRNLLVSTPDLLRLLPEAQWQPNLVPLDDPSLAPSPLPPLSPLTLSHSPTRKDLKNTDELLAVHAELLAEFPDLRLDVIHDRPWSECLARKRASHMVFDHMQGYYGVSSLESLALARPCVAGLDEWNSRHIRSFFGCEELPWVIARNPEELKGALRELAANPAWRAERGEAGRVFMERFWNAATLAGRLAHFWEHLV